MKFFLCGGLDAPDWILAEITTLSKLSSVRTKLLAVHIIRHILEGSFDYNKVLKLTADSSLGLSDVKACIAAVHFFITSAAKFDLDENTVTKELQQLGLPKEHSDSLCWPYRDNKEQLQAKLLHESLKIRALSLDGWQIRAGELKGIFMRLSPKQKVSHQVETSDDVLLCVTSEKLQLLLHELKTLRALMEEIL